MHDFEFVRMLSTRMASGGLEMEGLAAQLELPVDTVMAWLTSQDLPEDSRTRKKIAGKLGYAALPQIPNGEIPRAQLGRMDCKRIMEDYAEARKARDPIRAVAAVTHAAVWSRKIFQMHNVPCSLVADRNSFVWLELQTPTSTFKIEFSGSTQADLICFHIGYSIHNAVGTLPLLEWTVDNVINSAETMVRTL